MVRFRFGHSVRPCVAGRRICVERRCEQRPPDSRGWRGMGAPRDPPGERATRDWGWVPYPEGHRKRASFIKNYESMLATREACRAHVYRPDVRAFLDSAAFQLARSRRTLTYDPDAHRVSARFRAATRDPGGDPTADLSTLHHRFETPHDRARSHLEDNAIPRTARSSVPRARRVRGRLRRPGARGDPLAVVQPISGEDRALYAAFPCVRVQQPCDFHTIRVHVDGMYNHPEWLHKLLGTLTLGPSREQRAPRIFPGRRGLRAARHATGLIARFDGATCAHYTLANTTGAHAGQSRFSRRSGLGVGPKRRGVVRRRPRRRASTDV